MTRKELVKMLEECFAEDEEVKFVLREKVGDERYKDEHCEVVLRESLKTYDKAKVRKVVDRGLDDAYQGVFIS